MGKLNKTTTAMKSVISSSVFIAASLVSFSSRAVADSVLELHLGSAILFRDVTQGELDRCSIGLPARDVNGRVGFITAGHCAHKVNQRAFIIRRNHKIPIGKMVSFMPYREGVNPDFGFVVLDDSNQDGFHIAIDHLVPTVGQITAIYRGVIPTQSVLCKRGSTSGITCGSVLLSGDRFAYFGNTGRAAQKYGNDMSLPGDSGGVVFYQDQKTKSLVAVGIVTDHITRYYRGIPPGYGVVQTVGDIERTLHVTAE